VRRATSLRGSSRARAALESALRPRVQRPNELPQRAPDLFVDRRLADSERLDRRVRPRARRFRQCGVRRYSYADCSDGKDNDNNGFADCDDFSCNPKTGTKSLTCQ
jgi:hypothetical protein